MRGGVYTIGIIDSLQEYQYFDAHLFAICYILKWSHNVALRNSYISTINDFAALRTWRRCPHHGQSSFRLLQSCENKMYSTNLYN